MLSDCVKWKYGTQVVDLEKVKLNIANVRAGAYWKATSHYMMMLVLMNKLRDAGIGVSEFRYYLSRNNFDMVSSMQLHTTDVANFSVRKNGSTFVIQPSLGIAYSNMRRKALTFYAGYSCPEIGASFVVSKWHGSRFTFNFHVHREMENAIAEWRERITKGFDVVENFRKTILREGAMAGILTESGARGLIPWSRIGMVANTMRSMHQSVFHLALSFSEAIVSVSPNIQMDRLHEFHAVSRYKEPNICGDKQDDYGYGIIPEIF